VDSHIDAISVTAFVADDKSNSSFADPLAGTGEGTGAMQRFLQPLHHLPQGEDAERKLASF
jgi:hypothetical protein